MSSELILSFFSVIGISGIIGAFLTYFWNRKKEIELKNFEFKEKRYKSIILLMYAYLNPSELQNIIIMRPDLKNIQHLKEELITERVNSWLFANDDTILNFKWFLADPSNITYAKTILSMRKELWNKKSKLHLSIFSTDQFFKWEKIA